MHVEPFHIHAKISGRGDHLHSKRLVDLHQVHVVDCHSGARQGTASSLHRSEAHDLRTQGTDTCGDNASQRRQTQLGCALVAHDHHSCRPIVECTTVACSD